MITMTSLALRTDSVYAELIFVRLSGTVLDYTKWTRHEPWRCVGEEGKKKKMMHAKNGMFYTHACAHPSV
jgi:hypothetical protein